MDQNSYYDLFVVGNASLSKLLSQNFTFSLLSNWWSQNFTCPTPVTKLLLLLFFLFLRFFLFLTWPTTLSREHCRLLEKAFLFPTEKEEFLLLLFLLSSCFSSSWLSSTPGPTLKWKFFHGILKNIYRVLFVLYLFPVEFRNFIYEKLMNYKVVYELPVKWKHL